MKNDKVIIKLLSRIVHLYGFRKFDGEIFHIWAKPFTKKSDADKEATWLRKAGWKVRMYYRKEHDAYYLYLRKNK